MKLTPYLKKVIPHFDEIELYLYSLALLLLYFSNEEFQTLITSLFRFRKDNITWLFFLLILAVSIPVSLYSVIFKHKMSSMEKTLMSMYVFSINTFAGLHTFSHFQKDNSPEYLIIIPALNFTYAFITLVYYMDKVSANVPVKPVKEVSMFDFLISTAILLALFFTLGKYYNSHWTINISLCLLYSSFFHKRILPLIARLRGRKANL